MLSKTSQGRILKIAVFSALLAVAIFLLPNFAFAQVDTGISNVTGTGLSDSDPRIIIAKVIRVVLGFLGVIALLLVLYAGWLYMTSGGEPAKVDEAKKILSSAAIGLVIILSAFAIASFILNILNKSISGNGGGAGGNKNFAAGVPTSGNSIIESHYPERSQRDVPRNTSIVVTFKEAIDVTQIIQNTNGSATLGDWVDTNSNGQMDVGEYDTINPNIVLIYKTDDGSASSTLVTNVFANVMPDNKTFRFKPVEYLGSPSEEIWYSTAFSIQLNKANGTRAFAGAIGSLGYEWSFLVSTIIDVTPPRIINIIPYPSTTEPRNVVVQINYNEAVNPISSSGSTAGFSNIFVNNDSVSPLSPIDGNFYISNQYRTVEFLTEDLCGKNSCGDRVYCLPATSTIGVLVKAATLVFSTDPAAIFPFDGVVDMADNSLDGNKDSVAQGPDSQSGMSPYNANTPDATTQGDSFRWSFSTTAEILLGTPSILGFSPNIAATDIGYNEIPTAKFSRLMMSSSMKKHTVTAPGSVAFYSLEDVPFWLTKFDDIPNKQTTIEIKHSALEDFGSYTPEFNSGLKDIYQNCYYPSAGTDNFGSTCTPTPTSTPAYPYCCEGALSTTPCN